MVLNLEYMAPISGSFPMTLKHSQMKWKFGGCAVTCNHILINANFHQFSGVAHRITIISSVQLEPNMNDVNKC